MGNSATDSQLTYLVVEGDAVGLFGGVAGTLGDEDHLGAVVGVGADSEHTALLVEGKFVKAHWANKAENKLFYPITFHWEEISSNCSRHQT